jgi:hypothetical protein
MRAAWLFRISKSSDLVKASRVQSDRPGTSSGLFIFILIGAEFIERLIRVCYSRPSLNRKRWFR